MKTLSGLNDEQRLLIKNYLMQHVITLSRLLSFPFHHLYYQVLLCLLHTACTPLSPTNALRFIEGKEKGGQLKNVDWIPAKDVMMNGFNYDRAVVTLKNHRHGDSKNVVGAFV